MRAKLLALMITCTTCSVIASGPVVHLPARKQSAAVMRESMAYPNPFVTNTTIFYNPAISGQVAIRLYTSAGQLVGELFNNQVESGQFYEFELNGSELIQECITTLLRAETAFFTSAWSWSVKIVFMVNWVK